MSEKALRMWRQKLDRYREAEALATGTDEKYRLEHQIIEAQKKVAELEALLAPSLVAPASPAAPTPAAPVNSAASSPPSPGSPARSSTRTSETRGRKTRASNSPKRTGKDPAHSAASGRESKGLQPAPPAEPSRAQKPAPAPTEPAIRAAAPAESETSSGRPPETITGEARRHLWKLMMSLFINEELRRFLDFFPTIPGIDELKHAIPEQGSLEDITHKFIGLAERRGILRETFQELRRHAPRRVPEIEAVELMFPREMTALAAETRQDDEQGPPPREPKVSPAQARDPRERPGPSPAPQALPPPPTVDEVDLEKRLAGVLAKGPDKLVEKLDAHLTTPVPLTNLTPVTRVAKKLVQLGKGAEATATMLDAGFHAWQDLAKTADFTPARERVRELAGVWLPWGYATRERVKVVQRLRPSDEASPPRTMEPCDDLELMVVRPDFAEVFVALVDRRLPSFRTEHGGPTGPRQLVSPLALTLPPSLVELKPGQWLQDFKDSIARLLAGEMVENRRLWYRAANAMAGKLRKYPGTERYQPLYVLVRGLDQQRGFSTDEVEDIKTTFPALRIVVLMREPGDADPCPEFLLVDSDLLPNLKFIFEDPAT